MLWPALGFRFGRLKETPLYVHTRAHTHAHSFTENKTDEYSYTIFSNAQKNGNPEDANSGLSDKNKKKSLN